MKHGILLIKKPKGITSYDVIRILKKKFKTSKIGHAGSLDPFASGLLIIGINEGTKILPFLEILNKEYIAELVFGKSTDTFDVTGKLTKEKDIKKYDNYELEKVLSSFVGEYWQTPPVFSALKLNGKPLYKYARNDEKIVLKKRLQHIYDLKIVNYDINSLIFYVKCDKGTYIRSLGVDIANKLNQVGYLNNLERIKIGNYQLAMAKKVDEINEDDIIDIFNLPFKHIEVQDKKKIINGAPVKLNVQDDIVLIVNNHKAIAIYERNKKDMLYYCRRGFYYENL